MFLFLFLLERDETAKRGNRRGNADYTGSSVMCEHVFACECLSSSCLSVCISFFCLYISVCVSLSVSLSMSLCVFMSVSLSLCSSVSLHMYFAVCASLSVSLVPCHYMCLSVDVFSMCICVGVSLYVSPSGVVVLCMHTNVYTMNTNHTKTYMICKSCIVTSVL